MYWHTLLTPWLCRRAIHNTHQCVIHQLGDGAYGLDDHVQLAQRVPLLAGELQQRDWLPTWTTEVAALGDLHLRIFPLPWWATTP
jgi:hypothetical protein